MYITLIVKICMTAIIIVISGDNEEADKTAVTATNTAHPSSGLLLLCGNVY